jgi:SAM-dependent methyltransferase
MRVCKYAVEQPKNVVHVRNEVSQDDIVEGLAEIDPLPGGALEADACVAFVSEVDHPAADVDTGAAGRVERCQQLAAAGADLEHALPRGDVKSEDLLDQPVIAARPLAPSSLGRRELIEEIDELGVLGSRRTAVDNGRRIRDGHRASIAKAAANTSEQLPGYDAAMNAGEAEESAEAGASLRAQLAEQERAWRERPLLRRLYRGWDELIAANLARVPGPTVELGSGIGHFKEVWPEVIATDVESTRWADEVVDAESLPYGAGTLANLVLVDVFHHLGRPSSFLDEARRTLAPGGRVVLLDPYCSPISTWAYQRFHHERTDMAADPFADDGQISAAPMESNQARATLAFFRHSDEFERRWPELKLVERRRLALFLYPLSGGFSRPPLVLAALFRPIAAAERLARPLAPALAFRCLVVLERG